MTPPTAPDRPAVARHLLFVGEPRLWPHWPYLPLVRRWPGGREELGVLYDFRGTSGRTGYSATVVLANVFELPATEEDLLRLPREVYDTPDEVVAAGWQVD